MLFMIEWRSLDPKASSSAFMSGTFPLPPKVKVLASVHVIDRPEGYMLVDCSAEDLYAVVLGLPPNVLELTTNAVVDDAAAKKGLETRHSGYKMK